MRFCPRGCVPPDFKKIVLARFFYSFAVEMMAVIVGWRMYALTHDPLHLGLIGLAEAFPALTIALYAGYIVDRSRPLLVYLNVVFGSLISIAIVLLSQLPTMGIHPTWQVLALYAASFMGGAARGFSQPSYYAAVPRMLSRTSLAKASAWSSTSMQIARIAGPGIGGFLFGWVGVSGSAGLAILLLLAAFFAVVAVKNKPPAPASPKNTDIREELFSGARFVWKHSILFPALTLDMVSVLFGGVTALLPIFAADILHIGPTGLGALRAAPAVGAGLMSLWLTRFEIKQKAGPYLFTSVAGFGVCILIFGFSHHFLLSLFALGLSGAFDSVSMVVRSAAVQLASPDAMRGRISAVNSIFIGSSNELGEFESGIAASLLGTVPAVLFGGVMCLATVLVVFVVSPTLRNLHLGKLEEEGATA
jgi:MFS family permease